VLVEAGCEHTLFGLFATTPVRWASLDVPSRAAAIQLENRKPRWSDLG
jgi:hypothetical protein